MPERMGHTEPFQSGQQTNARDKGEKVPIKFKMAKERNIGQPDPLAEAIKGRDSYIPRDLHPFTHSKASKPGGAHYSPAGEYGRPHGKFGSKATGMGSHTSRPGSNAVGKPDGGRGGNPLGSPQNKQGLNIMGGHGGSGSYRGRG
jgi:hypothetical protein